MSNANVFPFARNRYFYGKLLTVRDFEVEQRYHCTKRELLNRLLHGAGVVCGLGVTASDESTLMIESGMALDYQGREIVLPEALFRKLPMLEGHETLTGKKDAYLCLAYHEEDVEPVNAKKAAAPAAPAVADEKIDESSLRDLAGDMIASDASDADAFEAFDAAIDSLVSSDSDKE